MKFLKEYLCVIFIIVFIFGIDFFISKELKELSAKIEEKINIVQEKIEENEYDKKEVIDKVNDLEKEWEIAKEKMFFYAEHSEIEKVSTDIVTLKSNIDIDKKEDAYVVLEEIKFKIEYIKNKQKLKFNNIF